MRFILALYLFLTVHPAPPKPVFHPAPKGECLYHDAFQNSCDAGWDLI